jgi:hypothetical protein
VCQQYGAHALHALHIQFQLAQPKDNLLQGRAY